MGGITVVLGFSGVVFWSGLAERNGIQECKPSALLCNCDNLGCTWFLSDFIPLGLLDLVMSTLLNKYEDAAQAPLESATSLPFASYHDEAVYRLEVEQIFRNEWVFVCAERELPNNGDYFALNLAGEGIVVIRDRKGHLGAISNNCRHRGTPLLDEGLGSVKRTISCPYHAWTYDTTGRFMGAPHVGDIKIDRESHCLPTFHVEVCLGLVFVNLCDDPVPFSTRFQGLKNFADRFEPDRFSNAKSGRHERWKANWKLAMENAMESYHLFKVHKDTLETVTPTEDAYYVAGSADWSITGGKMKDRTHPLLKWLQGETPQYYQHYLLFSLPPSFVGIMTYDSFGWISVHPKDHEQCRVRSGATFVGDGETDPAEDAFAAAFFEEDKVICERVQEGMYSRSGHGGKLVEMERVVVDFHQFLASRLFGSDVDGYFDNSDNTVFGRENV